MSILSIVDLRLSLTHTNWRAIVAIVLGFSSWSAAAQSHSLYFGLGLLGAEFTSENLPYDSSLKPYEQLDLRYSHTIGARWGMSPFVSYTIRPQVAPDKSYSTAYNAFFIPIFYRISESSESKVGMHWEIGPGILEYTIKGAGGFGGMTGNESNPDRTETINYYALDAGVGLTYSRFLFSLNSIWTRIHDSNQRTLHFLLTGSFGVF